MGQGVRDVCEFGVCVVEAGDMGVHVQQCQESVECVVGGECPGNFALGGGVCECLEEGEACDGDEGDGGQVEEERVCGGDDVVEECAEGDACGGVDCSCYAVVGDGVGGGGLGEREWVCGGARGCVVGPVSGGRGL